MRPFLLAAALAIASASGRAQTLRVWHVDVGQGDGAVIVSPTGTVALVDVGTSEAAGSAVIPLLQSLGVTQVHHLIVSHYHADHFGGVDEVVAAGFPPIVAWDRGGASLPGSLSTYVNAVGTARTTMTPGMVIALGGGATLTCIAGNGSILGGGFVDPSTGDQEENSRSLVLRLDYLGFQEVFGGDLTGGGGSGTTANVEAIAGPAVGDVDVYKVHHHGSATSSIPAFLAATDPEVAVVSCGVNNPYNHPAQSVMNALVAHPTMHAVCLTTAGNGAAGGHVAGGTILIETDGLAYTVSGGALPVFTRPVDSQPAAFQPGDVVISEVLQNPAAVPDASGEWFEIRNRRDVSLDLTGFQVSDLGVDAFTIPSLVLPPGGAAVLGASTSAAANGGAPVTLAWPAGSFYLGNGADEILLRDASGTLIDQVLWDGGPLFPDPAGASMERIDLSAPAQAGNFGVALASFGAGDMGTPMAVNSLDHTPPAAALQVSGAGLPGTTLNLILMSAGSAGRPFILGASEATSPALVLPASGRAIPLYPGLLLPFSLTPGNGIFTGMSGSLNIFGIGSGAVLLPTVALPGFTFHVAGVVVDASYPDGLGAITPARTVTLP